MRIARGKKTHQARSWVVASTLDCCELRTNLRRPWDAVGKTVRNKAESCWVRCAVQQNRLIPCKSP